MANNEKPASKTRIDPEADKALKQLDQVAKAHPELQAELTPIKTSLITIKGDPHKAQ
jgi:hypothetical protein